MVGVRQWLWEMAAVAAAAVVRYWVGALVLHDYGGGWFLQLGGGGGEVKLRT